MRYIIIYYLAGVIGLLYWVAVHEESISLKDILLVMLVAFFWPLILMYEIFDNADKIIVWKRKE